MGGVGRLVKRDGFIRNRIRRRYQRFFRQIGKSTHAGFKNRQSGIQRRKAISSDGTLHGPTVFFTGITVTEKTPDAGSAAFTGAPALFDGSIV